MKLVIESLSSKPQRTVEDLQSFNLIQDSQIVTPQLFSKLKLKHYLQIRNTNITKYVR